ncbi:hypothetical protein NF867_08925 [Solitalea sp. MAHUQ-68]|uniref:Uncharacterized protein n=1 Tax=Solitalea agri TaxID=2953739 RepID=A0A9X2F6Y2_9SPHI|nr:hypothetical protein [Solitalea agri]MCO4292983.1 hypothetical protein [Solitalea agri]
MKFLNRFSLHLHYKLPYLNWYNSIFPDESFASLEEINQTEKTTFLIPVFDSDEEIEEYLEENFEQFFIDELFGVSMAQETWPQDITIEMFYEWFEVDVTPMVVDYGDEELIDDESEGFSDIWDEDEEEEENEDNTEDDNIRHLPKPPSN